MAAFKVLDYPHLGMRLEVGAIYTQAELETRCGRHHPERRRMLHRKLADKSLFKPVSLRRALQRVKKTIVKKESQPLWVKPPALRGRDANEEVGRCRLIADGMAASILRDADEKKILISDEAVLLTLRAWGFHLNRLRTNVIPAGQDGVFSDTLGLTRSRAGITTMSSLSRRYQNITKLLMTWFSQHKPSTLDDDFPVTSISVNSSYAAKRHRDKNNAGPSVIRAFGSFKGGNLRYWPGDDRRVRVEELQRRDSQTLRVRTAAAVFDGRRAHEVTPFQGRERFSLVFFTVGKYWEASHRVKLLGTRMGFCLPTPESLKRACAVVSD